MAWGTPDKVTYGVATGSNPDITHNLGANTTGRLLVVFVSNEEVSFNAEYATGVTVGATSLTEDTDGRALVQSGTFHGRHQVFYGVNEDDTGDTTVSVAIGSADYVQTVVFELTGADTSSPIGAVETNAVGNEDDQTYSITTANADSMILCGMHGKEDSATPATGITESVDEVPQSDFIVWAGYRLCTTATSYTAGCTLDNGGSNFGQAGAGTAVEIKKASSGVEGTLTATLDPVDFAATGALAITGQTAATLAGVDFTAAGALALTGALSATLDPIDFAATGALATVGQTTATLQPIDFAATGALALTGAVSATLESIDFAATGALDSGLSGTLTATLESVDFSATGALALTGAVSATLDPVDFNAAGGLAIAGQTSATLDPVEFAASGLLALTGAVSATLDPIDFNAAAALAITGQTAATLEPIAFSAAGALAITGQMSATLDPIDFTAFAGAGVSGQTTVVLDPIDFAATGALAITGQTAATLAGVDFTAAGALALTGALSATLDPIDFAATGALATVGQTTATLQPIDFAATGALALTGAVSATLDPVAFAAAGELNLGRIVATLSATLDPIAFNAIGHRPISTYSICAAVAFVLRANLAPAVTVYCDRRRPIPPAQLPAIDVRRKLLSTNILDQSADLATAGIDVVIFGTGDTGDDIADGFAADVERLIMNSVMLDRMTLDIVATNTESRQYDDGAKVFHDVAVQFDFEYVESRA